MVDWGQPITKVFAIRSNNLVLTLVRGCVTLLGQWSGAVCANESLTQRHIGPKMKLATIYLIDLNKTLAIRAYRVLSDVSPYFEIRCPDNNDPAF